MASKKPLSRVCSSPQAEKQSAEEVRQLRNRVEELTAVESAVYCHKPWEVGVRGTRRGLLT